MPFCTNIVVKYPLPLSKDALHINKSGSRKAIDYYKKSLKRFPGNYKAKWLLNIAYMTIGEYPVGVPNEYYIDFKKFPQYNGLSYFNNLAIELGVDTYTFFLRNSKPVSRLSCSSTNSIV